MATGGDKSHQGNGESVRAMCLYRRASLRRDASKILVTGCDPQGRTSHLLRASVFPMRARAATACPRMNKTDGRMADRDQKGKHVLCIAVSTVLEKRDPCCFSSEARTDTRVSERDQSISEKQTRKTVPKRSLTSS